MALERGLRSILLEIYKDAHLVTTVRRTGAPPSQQPSAGGPFHLSGDLPWGSLFLLPRDSLFSPSERPSAGKPLSPSERTSARAPSSFGETLGGGPLPPSCRPSVGGGSFLLPGDPLQRGGSFLLPRDPRGGLPPPSERPSRGGSLPALPQPAQLQRAPWILYLRPVSLVLLLLKLLPLLTAGFF